MERPLERPSNGASVLRKAEGEGNLGRREVDAADVPLGYGTERSLAALSAAASYTSELYTPFSKPANGGIVDANPNLNGNRNERFAQVGNVPFQRASLPGSQLLNASTSAPVDYSRSSDPYFARQQVPQGEYPVSGEASAKRPVLEETERRDEDEDGDDGGEGNEGSARPLKATKRAAQNRSAQRAFRERKEQYVRELERKSAMLDETLARERELMERLDLLENSPDLLHKEQEAWAREREVWAKRENDLLEERQALLMERQAYLKENEGLKGALEETRKIIGQFAARGSM